MLGFGEWYGTAEPYREEAGMSSEWLSSEDLSNEFRIPLPSVRRWRYTGLGPPGVKLGRHVRYRREDVDRWIEQRKDPVGAKGGRNDAA